MPLTYSQPVNYPSPLTPIPSNLPDPARFGRYQVPVEILWDSMGGTNKSVSFDARENAPSEDLGQIASLIVDNSECAVAVTIIFPDTSEKLVIPASAKRVAVNVYTNGLIFVASAAGAGAGAITRLQVFNYRIPNIYIP